MRMKFNGRRTKAIRMCALSIFTLMLCGIVTYAWLGTNRELQQLSGTLSMAYDDTSASYDVYKYDHKTSQGYKTEEGITSIDVEPYDLIFKQRNRLTPVFARIEITRNYEMPKSGILYVTIRRSPKEDDVSPSNKLAKYCSSIMRFTAHIDTSYWNSAVNTSEDAYYKAIDDPLYPVVNQYKAYDPITGVTIPESSKCFVTVSESGDTKTYTKSDSITLQIPYSADQWHDKNDESGESVLNVCLYMTYDEGMIECYRAKGSGGTGTFSDGIGVVHFTNDLSSVVISYAPAAD